MKVLQICHSPHPPFADLTEAWARAAHANGWEVVTLFLSGEHASNAPGRWHSLGLTSEDLGGLRLRAKTRFRAAMEGDNDLVVAHRWKAIQLASSLQAAPVLGVAHEFGLLDRFSRRWFVRRHRRQLTLASVSQPVVRELTAHAAGAVLVPNVLDLDRYSIAPRAEAVDALRLETGVDRWVGHVGRLHRKKSLPVLLRAFAQLVEQGKNADLGLLLIGDGPERQALGQLAGELGIESRVHFAGFVADARRWLRALDLLVVSSGAEEAFGLTVLEGIAAGVPVVTSDVGGPASLFAGALPRFRSGDAASLAETLRQALAVPWPAEQLAGELRSSFSVEALARSLREIAARILRGAAGQS